MHKENKATSREKETETDTETETETEKRILKLRRIYHLHLFSVFDIFNFMIYFNKNHDDDHNDDRPATNVFNWPTATRTRKFSKQNLATFSESSSAQATSCPTDTTTTTTNNYNNDQCPPANSNPSLQQQAKPSKTLHVRPALRCAMVVQRTHPARSRRPPAPWSTWPVSFS